MDSPVPVILVSAYSDLNLGVATAVGALTLLRKPIDPRELSRRVRDALARAGRRA
jgi:DNA-binding response OmpR family regulator